jgi:hypothetical protein
LVSRLRNELNNSQSLRTNHKKKEPPNEKPPFKTVSESEKYKQKSSDTNRSLLIKNSNNKERPPSLITSHGSDSDNCDQNNVIPKERQPSADSSSEENRTPPCQSPVNGKNGEFTLRLSHLMYREVQK